MRLIDADELKAKVEAMVEHKVQESDYDYSRNQTLDYVADILIEDAPTIYAEPVKHGEWKCMADCGVTECDQCGWSIEEYVGDYNFCPNCGAEGHLSDNYCPNCGTKMDKDGEREEK